MRARTGKLNAGPTNRIHPIPRAGLLQNRPPHLQNRRAERPEEVVDTALHDCRVPLLGDPGGADLGRALPEEGRYHAIVRRARARLHEGAAAGGANGFLL